MNRLVRSRNNRMLAGVCGGIAELYGWDVSLVRIIAAIICASTGTGVLLYIIAALIIPNDYYGE